MDLVRSLDHSICDSRPSNKSNRIDEYVIHNFLSSLLCSHSFCNGQELEKTFIRFLISSQDIPMLSALSKADNWGCCCYSEKCLVDLKRPDFVFEISGSVAIKIVMEMKWRPQSKAEWERAKIQINSYLSQKDVDFVIVLVHADDLGIFNGFKCSNEVLAISYENEIASWLENVIRLHAEPWIIKECHLVSQLFGLYSVIHPTKDLPRKEFYSNKLAEIFTEFKELCFSSHEGLDKPYRILVSPISTQSIKGKIFFRIVFKNADLGFYSIDVFERLNRLFFGFNFLSRRLSSLPDEEPKETFFTISRISSNYKYRYLKYGAESKEPISDMLILYQEKDFSTHFSSTAEELIWPFGYPKNIAKDFFNQFLEFKQIINHAISEA